MNISISLTSEQNAALDDLLAEYVAPTQSAPISADTYLQTVLMGVINDKVSEKFNKAASELVKAVQEAPYPKQVEIISLVKSTLSEP